MGWPEVQCTLMNPSPAEMKSTCFTIRFLIFLLAIASIGGCSDLEKLFSDSNKRETNSPGIAPASAPKTPPLDFKMSPACLFPQAAAPENIDVYAIDGQAWIDQAAKLESVDSDSPLITINVDTPEPAALLLTADKTARWRITTTPRTKLWGVYVSAFEPQRVSGVITPTKFQEHYRSLGDNCGIYWAPEFQVHQLYEFSRQIFGKPYVALPKIVNGSVDVKSLGPIVAGAENPTMQHTATLAGATEPTPAVKTPAPQLNPPATPMTLSQALRANVIRPGTPADLDRFRAKYRSVNQREMGKRLNENVSRLPIYVITGDYTFSSDESLAGANAVLFILDKRVPYPTGDSGHSPILDMNTGACMGQICGFYSHED